ncbi:hypothetical protein [Streptomyces sp. NPDC050504]|uniref:hypothetical protein n=1 Tax=Streptomyces sp. NPDC050504 TaxID=3365618 RepID=UPI0037B7D04E
MKVTLLKAVENTRAWAQFRMDYMKTKPKGQRGQGAVEYMGIIIVVVAIVLALMQTNLGTTISTKIKTEIAKITG